MSSSLLLVLFVGLLAQFAYGAPAGTADDVKYTRCKALSVKLNEMARDLYHKVESKKMAIIIDEPPMSIRPIDKCDPWSLQSNKETCQSRIILALKNYTRIFHKDGVFINDACSNWREQANKIAEVTGDLLQVLIKEPVEHAPLDSVNWHDSALCRDSVERLYSFSIISARVFSFLASPVAPTAEMKQC